MRVLIIEDDPLMVRSIGLILDNAGFQHEMAGFGETGIELAKCYDYDAILLDLSLPDLHGYKVLRQLRQAHLSTPVIILTGDNETSTKVVGFDIGADDYITKPFDRDELIARLHALVRRSQGHAGGVIQTGSISVDLASRCVSVGAHHVRLTQKEYAVIELLTLRKGSTLTKEMFLTHLYGGHDAPEPKIIDVFVCKLRKKLSDAGPDAARCVETVWGRGYALRDPEIAQTAHVA